MKIETKGKNVLLTGKTGYILLQHNLSDYAKGEF